MWAWLTNAYLIWAGSNPSFRRPPTISSSTRIGPDRIEHDDAVRRDHGPGRIFLLADIVEVVEHLDRLVMPGRAIRHALRAGRGRRRTRLAYAGRLEQSGMLSPGRSLGRSDMGLGSPGLRQRDRCRRGKGGGQRADDAQLHCTLPVAGRTGAAAETGDPSLAVLLSQPTSTLRSCGRGR
jgi:hypothetical protein